MYYQFINKKKESPLLYIHNDEEEFERFLKEYLKNLKKWQHTTEWIGMPLGRLEPSMVIVDFIHKLTNYYIKNSGNLIKTKGRIVNWIRIYNNSEIDDFLSVNSIKLIDLDTWEIM